MNTSSSSTTVSWTPSDADRLKAQSRSTAAQVARMTIAVAEYQEQATRLEAAMGGLMPWL